MFGRGHPGYRITWSPECMLCSGSSTWASRVAFAAAGWLSVILLARVSYQIYRDHRVALASAVLLGTSEIFLLHSRQCRYYSVTVFAEILLIYGAFQILTNRKGGSAIWLLGSALIVQFYANFLIAIANLPLLLALSWFTRKQTRSLVKVPIALGLFALAALPWIFYAHTWQQSGDLANGRIVSLAVGDIAMRAFYYVTEWNFHFVPWILLVLPIVGLVRRHGGAQTSSATGWLRPLEQSLSILFVCSFFPIPADAHRTALLIAPFACRVLAGLGVVISLCPVANFGGFPHCPSVRHERHPNHFDPRIKSRTRLASPFVSVCSRVEPKLRRSLY